MSNLAASREETFSRHFHVVAEKYRRLYRFTPDLIDPAVKAFLVSIDYAEDEFIAFVEDYVGTAEESFERFRLMANRPDVIAQSGLAYMYANGLGTTQDHGQAVFWYLQAAEQGDVVAQTALGYLCANGLGTKQDYVQAAFWYHKAAEQKSVSAQSGLGYLYANGLGVDRDLAQAAFWHRQAAESESDYSQFCLGLQYEFGEGIPQDKSQAAVWYRKAADQGNSQAIEKLKSMETAP